MNRPIPTREQVVAEALSWVGTPYHPTGARVKGAGADCGSFIFAVFYSMGMVPDEDIGIFSMDWFANATAERYLLQIMRHAHKVAEAISYASMKAEPGNIVLTKHNESSRFYNHGGIVVAWPKIVHMISPKCALIDASKDHMWEYRTVVILDPWAKLKAEGKL